MAETTTKTTYVRVVTGAIDGLHVHRPVIAAAVCCKKPNAEKYGSGDQQYQDKHSIVVGRRKG
jgi:hypothetical protein